MMGRRVFWHQFIIWGMLAPLLLCGGRAVQAQQAPLSGRWVGGWRIGDTWVVIVVDLDDQVLLREGQLSALTAVRSTGTEVHLQTRSWTLDGDLGQNELSGRVTTETETGFFYLARAGVATPEIYDPYIGSYVFESSRRLLVTRSDGASQLFYMESDRQVALFPLADGRFFSVDGELLTFVRDQEGEVTGLSLRRVGKSSLLPGRFAPRVDAYREREITFSSGEVTLSGTLLMPLAEGSYPALVLVHGAGAAERHMYRIFADRFVQQGIVSLIYDKRGSGASTGTGDEGTLADWAQDALAGVRFLTGQPQVDAAQIGIWGLSQGGRVAPMVAGRSAQVAFVIAASAPAMSGAASALWHVHQRYSEDGYPPAVADMGLKYARLVQDVEWMTGVRSPDQARDPLQDWQAVSQPVLLVYGARDALLPAAESAARIADVLGQQGNRDVTVSILEEADHNLMVVELGSTVFADGILSSMGDWVRARSGDGGSFASPEPLFDVPELAKKEALDLYSETRWYGRLWVQGGLLVACVILLGYFGLGRLSLRLVRRAKLAVTSIWIDLVALSFSALGIAILGGLLAVLLFIVGPKRAGLALLSLLVWGGWIAILLAVVWVGGVVWRWHKGRLAGGDVAGYGAILVAACILAWLMGYWRLLGFPL